MVFKGEDGYGFIRTLKETHPSQKIILVSSILDRKKIIGLVNGIIYGYLLKPINVSHLLKQLEKVATLVHERNLLLHYVTVLENSSAPLTSKETQQATDNFLVFDTAERDDAINRMHYQDEYKISAQRFFHEGFIDNETRSDLVMYAKELAEESAAFTHLTPEYMDETASLIHVFANALELSGEFRDIAYALRGLCHTLHELQTSAFAFGPKSCTVKMIIDTIIDDLVNWTQQVLIDMSAVDVHYVDASLLANIAQLDLSVKTLTKTQIQEGLDDDLELF